MATALDAFADAVAAAAGGYFSCSVLFPLEIVKNKLQASQKSGLVNPTFFSIANEIYKEQGISGFIDGVTVSAVGSSTEKFVYFYAYSFARSVYVQIFGTAPGAIADLFVGYCCEFMHLPVSMPLDTLGVKIQTNKDPSLGVFSIVNKTLKETGLNGFYKGWQAYFGLAFKPAIQYAVFEQVKAYLLKGSSETELSFAQAFWLGALGRAVATIALFPYTRAKVLKQARRRSLRADSISSELPIEDDDDDDTTAGKKPIPKPKGVPRQASLSTTGVILNVVKHEGILGIYRGMGPEVGTRMVG